MLTLAAVAVLSLGAGFGLGRVKNKAKLAALQSELDKFKVGESVVMSAAVANLKKL